LTDPKPIFQQYEIGSMIQMDSLIGKVIITCIISTILIQPSGIKYIKLIFEKKLYTKKFKQGQYALGTCSI
jgi:hypothetical protein